MVRTRGHVVVLDARARARRSAASRSTVLTNSRAASSSTVANSAGPSKLRAVRQHAGRVDRPAPSSRVRHVPMRVEVLEREAQRVHPRVAARAHRILRDAARAARAPSAAPLPSAPSSSRAGTLGGGGGGGAPRRFSSSHLPRSTGEVRLGYDVTVRMLPLAEQAAPIVVGHGDAAEVTAVDVRDAVVPGQPFVEERVVGASAARGRCDPRAAGSRGTARSRAGTPRAGSRRSRETHTDPGASRRMLRRCSHWPREIGRPARCARGSASIRRTCCSSTAGVAQRRRARRRVEQLVVRDAAPEEKRQPRGQLESLMR